MREYATQMEAARRGIVTEELKKVAAKERLSAIARPGRRPADPCRVHTAVPGCRPCR